MSVLSFILMYLAVVAVLRYFHNRERRLRLECEPETHLSRVALAPVCTSSRTKQDRGPGEFRPQVGSWRARRVEFEY